MKTNKLATLLFGCFDYYKENKWGISFQYNFKDWTVGLSFEPATGIHLHLLCFGIEIWW